MQKTLLETLGPRVFKGSDDDARQREVVRAVKHPGVVPRHPTAMCPPDGDRIAGACEGQLYQIQ